MVYDPQAARSLYQTRRAVARGLNRFLLAVRVHPVQSERLYTDVTDSTKRRGCVQSLRH